MGSNNMDRVPVKIAERFKPPPRLYQLPQAISHKLQLPSNHYGEAPQYYYDFQLERKVLAKIPEWRRKRQQEREARRDRKEQREQEHLHAMEAQNKQMLGAVSYPSTEELSSSESDTEDRFEDTRKHVVISAKAIDRSALPIMSSQVSNFHNILQPTIVSSNSENFQISNDKTVKGNFVQSFPKNGIMIDGVKDVNTFNYKDFEEDTSSPFDNIELKAINDLDILAQVLHNTQMSVVDKHMENEVKEIKAVNNEESLESKENAVKKEREIVDNLHLKDTMQEASNLKIVENTKVALQKVEFENLAWDNENIPNAINSVNAAEQTCYIHNKCNNYNTHTSTSYTPYLNQQTAENQQSYHIPLNTLYNDVIEQQTHYTNFNVHAMPSATAVYGNRNYLYASNCNRTASAYCSPRHIQQNANNYFNPILTTNGPALSQQQQLIASDELNSKSKSVPDILKELSEEVHNSEMRRSRFYSCNSEDDKQCDDEQETVEDTTPKQSPVRTSNLSLETSYYAKLPGPGQQLAKNISSMGFPLERVAKIALIFGTDDKKIVEHLIPLSELMDLGFDEMQISEALIKFDNSKERALEYLIS